MDAKAENRSMQDDNGLGWGKSLPVPSVQNMVRNDSQTVPGRYIRESKDRPVIDGLSLTTSEIPVIDFSMLVNRDENEQKKLDFACQKWGFFQLVNHGVAEELLHKMKEVTRAFFELPLEEKNKYAMAENDLQGYGQAYVVSQDQKLDWNDLIFLLTCPPECRNLDYWPLTPPGFKKTVEEYSTEIYRVTEEIYANLSLLMGIQENSLKELHQIIKIGMRMNYYPPCSKPDLVLGLSPHSDGCTITLLLQDDDITGLQIKHEGTWIPVKPVPGVLVVNVGDIVEMWSNGTYKSVEHRAVTNATKERVSIATSVLPHEEAEIYPLETMVHDCPAMYKGFKYIEFLRCHLSRKLDGKVLGLFKLEGK